MTVIGAFLSDVPKEGEPLKIIGSAMVALAATKEEVVERLKADVYNANGVWDLSKVRQLSVSGKFYADEILSLGPNLPLQVVPVKDASAGFLQNGNTRDHDNKDIRGAPRIIVPPQLSMIWFFVFTYPCFVQAILQIPHNSRIKFPDDSSDFL